jgi:ABC-type Fe3+ transport system substrate-binding protein
MINLMKPAGILDSMDPVLILPEVKNPKVWRADLFFTDKENMVKPMRAGFTRFIMRNTDLVKEGEITSYWDLLDPKWKGKMVMYDPTGPGTGSGFVGFLKGIWGQEKTVEFLRQLVKQEPVITKDVRLPMEWVARGKYSLGIALRVEGLPEFLNLGSPVALVKVTEGLLGTPGAANLGIVNKRPHPNAAALFVNWILTKEGMTIWSKADGYAATRVDVPTDWVHPIFLPDPGEKVWVEDVAAIKGRRKLWGLAKEIFAPLLK